MGRRIPCLFSLLFASAMVMGMGTPAKVGLAAPSGVNLGQALGPSNTAAVISYYPSFGPSFGPAFGPGFGFDSGYSSPFFGIYAPHAPSTYLPDYWWASPYPERDPRQAGYNPSAGYAWDSVTTLLLETIPAKARVTLDGIYVGAANALGPIQLPMGEHTLRVDAAGYEPSETVIKTDQPVLQQLEIRLKPIISRAKPATRP